MSRRPLQLAIGATLLAVLCALSACGIRRQTSVQVVDPKDLPPALVETSVATTTTTIVETTLEPSPGETTTTLATEPIDLYFVASGKLTPISKNLPRPATPQQVLALLAAGPPRGDLGVGLRTAIPADSPLTVSVSSGVATVALPAALLSTPAADQQLAIGQIALTLYRPGIGQVKFVSDGKPIAVPRGDGSLTAAGGAVTADDYRRLVAGP
jgi:spore germination protein GerM